jgi:hypothetical protein
MTSERIKSHLQKFRKSREKEKCKFLEDYVTCMQTKSRIGALAAPSSVDKILIGSKVAAFFSLSVMQESEPKKEGESTPSKIPAQGFVQGVNEAGFPAAHIPFPELNKEEKNSPLGTSLMFAMGLIKHLEQYLVQESRGQGRMPQEEEPIKQPSETRLASQRIGMDEPGPHGMTSSPVALSQEIDLLERSHSRFPPSDIADYASMSATFPTRAQRHLPTSASFDQQNQSHDSQLRTELTAAQCSLQEQMLQDMKMHHMQTQLPGENPSDQKILETSKHRSAGHFGRFFPVAQGQMDLAIAVHSQPQNQPDTFPMSHRFYSIAFSRRDPRDPTSSSHTNSIYEPKPSAGSTSPFFDAPWSSDPLRNQNKRPKLCRARKYSYYYSQCIFLAVGSCIVHLQHCNLHHNVDISVRPFNSMTSCAVYKALE